MKNLRHGLLVLALLAFCGVSALRAQYQITTLGATITENFDSYTSVTGSTAPTFSNSLNVNTATTATQRGSAWQYFTASNNGATVTSNNFIQGNDTGSSQTGGFRSYGLANNTDRALGILASSAFGTFNGTPTNTNGLAAVSAQFVNATGGTVTSLVISFTGEQWRQVTAAASYITVGYSVSSATGAVTNAITSPISGLTFNAISVSNALGGGNNASTNSILNGYAAGNRNTTFTATLTGLNILSGGSINLAFAYAGGAGGGSRQGLAIDDLAVTANGVAAAASLLWSGASGDTWDTSTAKFTSSTVTWNNTGNATTTAEFGTANQNITVGTVTAGALKFSATGVALSGGTITDGTGTGLTVDVTGSNTATVASTVSTSAGITKTDSGTLILGGTQTAPITVSAGTLQSDTTTIGNAAIANGGTLVFAQGSDGTYSGTLTNTGTVVKGGAGNLTIGGTVTGAGATSITGGTLTAGIDNAISTGALNLGSGTTFDLANHSATASGLTLTGGTVANVGTLSLGTGGVTTNADAASSTISGGTLALGSTARTFNISPGGDLAISSNLTGAGTLTKAGAGTLTLTGVNSSIDPVTGLPTGFTGGLTLAAGTVVAGASNALPSGTILFDNGSLQGNGTALSLANHVQIGTGSVATNSIIGGSTDITFTGTWQQAGGTANTLTVNNTGNTTLNGTLDLTAANSTRTLTISGSGNTTINGVVLESNTGGNAVGALTKSGTGTLTLNGLNTYNGPTTITGGTLLANSNTALGTGVGITNGVNGATSTVNGGTTITGGTLALGTGVTLANTISVGSAGTISGSGTAALSGNVSGSGTFGGTITLGNGARLSPGTIGTAGILNNGGTLTFAVGSGYTWDIASLKDSATGAAGTDFDQFLNTGSVNLSNSALLTLAFSLANLAPDMGDSFWHVNHAWTVVSSSGGGSITGTALGLSNSQAAWSSLGSFSTSITGNNLQLTWTTAVIPEPATYAAVLGVLALTGVLIRRRRLARPAGTPTA